MRLDLHLHLEEAHETTRKLDDILHLLKEILIGEKHMTIELDTLTAKVEAIETVGDSVIALLNGISAQLAAIKDDPAKIQALADRLGAQGQEFADAITANTPAE
jgi:hypothetical protein